METRISRVFRKNGKVTCIHCGEWPNITVYDRVDIDGQRYFKLARYGKSKLYVPKNGRMDYARSI